jgi:hypothetical protein
MLFLMGHLGQSGTIRHTPLGVATTAHIRPQSRHTGAGMKKSLVGEGLSSQPHGIPSSIFWKEKKTRLTKKYPDCSEESATLLTVISQAFRNARSFDYVQLTTPVKIEHLDISPETLRHLLRNLAARQRCIARAIQNALEDLCYATEYVSPPSFHPREKITMTCNSRKCKLDATGGHDSSYIAGVMRPVYISCREQYGTKFNVSRIPSKLLPLIIDYCF